MDVTKTRPVRGWWYGIGRSPSSADITFAATHYDVVVLNAWETAAMRRLRRLNPAVTALVYKDFSSVRNYPGAVEGDKDAAYLPTGLGYWAAQRGNTGWFATDTRGRRVEWQSYPKHWQTAVWDPGYQKAWATAVTTEVVREGWDGVLADNDVNTLKWYSSAVLAGTTNAEGTDRLLRDGLDGLLAAAGDALTQQGKVLVPNVSETRLRPGRWTAHSRFGGALEEMFVLRGGNNALITFEGAQWQELRAQAALGDAWLLLMTRATSEREQRVGFAAASLLAGRRTCWSMSSTGDYTRPDWSRYQDLDLGVPMDLAQRAPGGVWTRRFTRGWVAVNPTTGSVTVTPPTGVATIDGDPAPTSLVLGAGDAVVMPDRR